MEVRLPGDAEENGGVPVSRSRSENSDSVSFGRNKALAAPRANEDYEDRFKKIIASELAKPGEKEPGKDSREINKMPLEMNRAKVTLSPTKMKNRPFGMDPGNSGMPGSSMGPVQDLRSSGLDPRSNFIPSRRPPDPRADPRSELRQIDPRAFDPRNQDPRHHDPRTIDPRLQDPRLQEPRVVQDPRTLPDSRSVQQIPDSRSIHPLPDSRTLPRSMAGDPRLDPRGRQIDPRVMMENRPQDPRTLDPRMQDPRNIDPRSMPQDPRSIDPRDQRAIDIRSQDPRTMDSRPQDQRALGPRGQEPRPIGEPRSQDQRTLDPRFQDPRSIDPRTGHEPRPQEGRPPLDGRIVSPQDPRARPDSRGSNPGASVPGSDGRNSEPKTVALPRDNRTLVVDHISSEIERSLMADRGPLPVSGSKINSDTRPTNLTSVNVTSTTSSSAPLTMSSQHMINMSVERAIQNHQSQSSASRLSKIIEESVRKDGVPEKKSIYATNRPNPNPSPSNEVMEGLACPRGTNSPSERKNLPGSLPQVEGLAARFDSYFEKEKASSRSEGLAGRFSSPDIPNSRPTSTGSKSSLHTPDITGEDSRKRPASPLVSPPLSKKPATSSSGDGSAPDETRRWQDEISMGFDRLVAMASEVDKRRKSAENSPQQSGSPRKGATDLRLNDASFDQNTLAAKFKAGLEQAGPARHQPDRRPPETEKSTGSGGAGSSQDKSQGGGPSPSFPGGNLPEHHFKKRYFNEEYQRQQQKETEQGRPGSQELNTRAGDHQKRTEQRQHGPEQGRAVQSQGYDQRRSGMQDMRDPRYDQAMRAQYDQARSGSRSHHQDQRQSHSDQSRQDPARHIDAQRGGSQQVSDQGRHQDQRMYQDSRRGHYEQQRQHDARGQHTDPRQRPQMYPGQGYPDRQGQREYPERNEYPNPRQLPDQYRHRGPAPSGQQGYPRHPYTDPQLMQAMYRHQQQMMYGNRPPPPPPSK